MIALNLATADLELAYDAIAEAIDAVPEAKRPLFLAKLAFVLANLVGDLDMVRDAIAAAGRDLSPVDCDPG